jgi:hypothetical protein
VDCREACTSAIGKNDWHGEREVAAKVSQETEALQNASRGDADIANTHALSNVQYIKWSIKCLTPFDVSFCFFPYRSYDLVHDVIIHRRCKGELA